MTITNDRIESLEFVVDRFGYKWPLFNYECFICMSPRAFNRNWIKRVK